MSPVMIGPAPGSSAVRLRSSTLFALKIASNRFSLTLSRLDAVGRERKRPTLCRRHSPNEYLTEHALCGRVLTR